MCEPTESNSAPVSATITIFNPRSDKIKDLPKSDITVCTMWFSAYHLLWFLKDGKNCLITEPSPAAMAEKSGWLIENEELRLKIQEGGYATVNNDWKPQLELIWDDVVHSKD